MVSTVPSPSLDRPWVVRRLLYLAAGVLLFVLAVVSPSAQTLIPLALAVGGLATSLARPDQDDPARPGIFVMGAYDMFTALVLAAVGLQYSSLLVMIGAVAAVGLLRPDWSRSLTMAAAVAGAGSAMLAVQVAGLESVIPADVAGPGFSLFVPMAAFGLINAGLARLFSSIGMRLRQVSDAQESLRTALDRTPAPTLIADGDMIVYANPASIVLVGRVLVGDSLRDVFGIDGNLGSGSGLRTCLSASSSATVTLDVQAHPVIFDGRRLTQITLTHLSEGQLSADGSTTGQRHLDLLFDRIPVALYRSTPSGEVTAANPALAAMLGLSDPAELIGEVERAQTHYRDSTGRRDWLAMFDHTDVVMNYEMELTKADGSVISVTDSARAVRGRDGEILFFEGVLIDVTEQRNVEEARRRTSEILEATSDLVWLTDDEDRINRLNAAMRTFLAGTDQQVYGTHVREFIAEGADSHALSDWRMDPDGDRVWRGEIGLRSVTGREILTSAVAQRHPNFISLVARDITEERRTAGQLERLVRAKDEFIASVSHELRTPLTAVVGLASELQSFYDQLDDQTKRDFIALVADQATEVAAIVEDLLVAARADTDSITLTHEDVDVRRAVDAVLMALPEAKRSQFEVEGEGCACGDAQRVRQIVRNLLTNAIRYGELPGTVTITGDATELRVAVADKGAGIDPDMIDRIFEPYERAHAAMTTPNSVGLGLSVSRWLAVKMGGSLVYENDTVSTFILCLPATRCA
jgi:PAS domain S-box-containing protein